MTVLSLELARRAADGACDHARAQHLNPLSIAVIDASGFLKFAFREDGAGISGVEIALGKARTALEFGMSSGQISEILAGNPLGAQSVLAIAKGRIMLMPGAVLLTDRDGLAIGAIGAAGDLPANDEAAAAAGAAVAL